MVMDAKSCPLRRELAQQPIGVLATTTLPRIVRVAEAHFHASGLGQLPVTCHFLALIVDERLSHGLGHLKNMRSNSVVIHKTSDGYSFYRSSVFPGGFFLPT